MIAAIFTVTVPVVLVLAVYICARIGRVERMRRAELEHEHAVLGPSWTQAPRDPKTGRAVARVPSLRRARTDALLKSYEDELADVWDKWGDWL